MTGLSTQPPAGPAGGAGRCAPVAVILLHGRGESPAHMLALSRRIDAPQADYVALSAADGSWYPQSFLAPIEANQPFLDDALGQVDDAVQALERAGWTRDRIVLLGFSQGACLACDYVWRRPARWGGLVAFTGGLIGPDGARWAPRPLVGTPVLLSNGDADPWVPWTRTEQTAAALRACGAEVEVMKFAGRSHGVVDDELQAARRLIDRCAAEARDHGTGRDPLSRPQAMDVAPG